MFGLSFAEIGVILIVALIVLGPEKLPEFARGFGKVSNMLKRQTDSLRREWYNAVYLPAEETKKALELSTRELRTIRSEALEMEDEKPKNVSEHSQEKKEDEKL